MKITVGVLVADHAQRTAIIHAGVSNQRAEATPTGVQL